MNKLMCTYVLYIHIRYNSSLIFLFTLYHRFHLSAIYILRPMPACFSIYRPVCLSVSLSVCQLVCPSVCPSLVWLTICHSQSITIILNLLNVPLHTGCFKVVCFFAWNCKYNRYVSLKIFRYYLTKKLAWKTFYF